MSTSWGSLYLRSADQEATAAALREALLALGYHLYDPFGLMPGKAYPQTVRLFVAPPQDGWTRVIGVPDERMIPSVSHVALCLSVLLHADGSAALETYLDGKPTALAAALTPFACGDLAQVFGGEYGKLVPVDDTSTSVFAALSGDAQMQALSSQVDPQQAQKMFDRLSGSLMKKAGGDAKAAQSLLNASTPDWNSAGGQRIRAVLACLNLSWREPEFNTLRDAYQLHTRRRRNPNARLYPGDEDAMNRVPDALRYIPVYGGQ